MLSFLLIILLIHLELIEMQLIQEYNQFTVININIWWIYQRKVY